ncbi:DUF5916 domain-containing protein [Alteromonadaceae bacterium BrNp21-10]|nr:DUF5916 domain-containing protein [Alteromonadaceae bacterium BrNp21-10]
MVYRLLFSFITCSFLFSYHANASDGRVSQYQLPHLNQSITLDGQLDESAWQQAAIIQLEYAIEPAQTVAAPVATTAYLFEDGKHLYIAIKADDPNPQDIRSSLRARDNIWNDDSVGIVIDTFNNQRTGFGFFVNPIGAQADFTVDDATEFDKDNSWDAIWYSAGAITDSGYIVEMQLPLHALRFQQLSDIQTWNIGVLRNYPRESWTEIANYPKDRDLKCTLCQYPQIVGLKGIQAGNSLQLTPTLTLGRNQQKDIGENQWLDANNNQEIGLDAKWGITQDIVVNATINPDFSQVEADAAQLNVNKAFALFYPEKRPFFLDGADYFNTSAFNLVHTRNIADPDYGAKITGKHSSQSYGLIVANDNRTDFLLPQKQHTDVAETSLSSNIVIGRYNVDLGNRNTLGGLITSRSADGYENQLLSVDGVYWLGDSNSISYQIANAETTNPLAIQESFGLKEKQSGKAYGIEFHRRTNDYEMTAEYERIDKDFRADLGFVEQANIEKVSLEGVRNWYTTNDSDWFKQYELKVEWDKTYDLQGELVENETELFVTAVGEKQFFGQIGLIAREQQYLGERFNERLVSSYVELTPIAPLFLWTEVLVGKELDYDNARLGDGVNIHFGGTWQANQHLQLELKYSYSALGVDSQEVYSANLADINFLWQFDMRSQLRFIVQHISVDRQLSLYKASESYQSKEQYYTSQLLYSYKINPQTLLFVGYSDNGLYNERTRGFVKAERTLFAKFSYAWQL